LLEQGLGAVPAIHQYIVWLQPQLLGPTQQLCRQYDFTLFALAPNFDPDGDTPVTIGPNQGHQIESAHHALQTRTIDPRDAKDLRAELVQDRVVELKPAALSERPAGEIAPQECLPVARRLQQARELIVTQVVETFGAFDRVGFGRAITQGYDVTGHQGFHHYFLRQRSRKL